MNAIMKYLTFISKQKYLDFFCLQDHLNLRTKTHVLFFELTWFFGIIYCILLNNETKIFLFLVIIQLCIFQKHKGKHFNI